jgi:uncharacterized protein YdiU (UPF0061 family)
MVSSAKPVGSSMLSMLSPTAATGVLVGIGLLVVVAVALLMWYVTKTMSEGGGGVDVRVHMGYAEMLHFLSNKTFGPLAVYEKPAKFAAPKMFAFNVELAKQLGLLSLRSQPSILSGQKLLKGSKPVALAYGGHQFGTYATLGDGRALLLGNFLVQDGVASIPYFLQLKGAGPTAFSRGGDGFLPLGPALREYLMSEALHALGIPTMRCLSVVTTDNVVRRKHGPTFAAVLARVSRSMERVGTFEHFKQVDIPLDGTGDDGHRFVALRALADHVIQNYFSELHFSLGGKPKGTAIYGEFVIESARRNAALVAKWQAYGFVHGVLNTDNVLVTGETIDYGPCAFLDAFDRTKVFSSIDSEGRYSYNTQPNAMLWNMNCLLEAIGPLLTDLTLSRNDGTTHKDVVREQMVRAFNTSFQNEYLDCMYLRLGVSTMRQAGGEISSEQTQALIGNLLQAMEETKNDYNHTFIQLEGYLHSQEKDIDWVTGGALSIHLRTPVTEDGDDDWLTLWLALLKKNKIIVLGVPTAVTDSNYLQHAQQIMQQANPRFIPRNHAVRKLIDEVQQIQTKSGATEVRTRFARAVQEVQKPFSNYSDLFQPPASGQEVTKTFCGT